MDIKRLGFVIDPTGARAGAAAVNRAMLSIGTRARAMTTQIRADFATLKNSLFGLKAAFATIGLGLVSRAFVRAAADAENFSVRLTASLGSVKEGNRLFEEMATLAGNLPFEFEEVMRSATSLAAVVRGGADEVGQLMPVIADLAAFSGLSIDETTNQIIRMYSAGAGAADLFRDRGVNAMLGFQAGVSYTAKETMDQVIREFERTDSKFRGTSAALATTWDGVMSMMADKWFIFRRGVMDAGLFDQIKARAMALNEIMDEGLTDNGATYDRWSQTATTALERVTGWAFALADAFRAVQILWGGMLVSARALMVITRNLELFRARTSAWFSRNDFEREQAVLSGLEKRVASLVETVEKGGTLFVSTESAQAEIDKLTPIVEEQRRRVASVAGALESAELEVAIAMDEASFMRDVDKVFAAIDDLQALFDRPLPSDNLDAWVERVQKALAGIKQAREDALSSGGRTDTDGLEAWQRAMFESAEAYKLWQESQKDLAKEGLSLTLEMETPLQRRNRLEEEYQRLLANGVISVSTFHAARLRAEEEYQDAVSTTKELLAAGMALTRELETPLERRNRIEDEYRVMLFERAITEETFDRARLRNNEEYQAALRGTTDMTSELVRATLRWGQSFEDEMINAAKTGELSFDSMAEAVLEDLARIIIRLRMIQPLVNYLQTTFPSVFGPAGGGDSGDAGGASGGYFPPGSVVEVGEHGRELVEVGPRGVRIVTTPELGRNASRRSRAAKDAANRFRGMADRESRSAIFQGDPEGGSYSVSGGFSGDRAGLGTPLRAPSPIASLRGSNFGDSGTSASALAASIAATARATDRLAASASTRADSAAPTITVGGTKVEIIQQGGAGGSEQPQVSVSRGSDGGQLIQIVLAAISRDIQQGGEVSRALRTQYGLRPTTVTR